MSNKVLFSSQLAADRLEALTRHCELHRLPAPGVSPVPASSDATPQVIQECRGLICLLTDRIDRAVLDTMPSLAFVSSVSVGVDHIDVQALTERGIPLGYTPGVLVDTTADTAFALLLAAARRVAEADRFVREGKWSADKPWSPDFFLGKDVSGATLGIVGLGEIGQAVARRAAGFGMRVIAWSRSGRELPGVENVALQTLLQSSDFVSVHLALTEETRGMLGSREVALMKPGAVLVNTARGGIVDELALAQALDSGQLYAAGIDVFEQEPVAMDNPLLQHPRVVVTPHIGSATTQTRAKMVDRAIDNATAALLGQPMPYCVNPQVYQRP